MKLAYLRAFVAVVEHGSLAAACQVLHLSQPAASRLIRLLEDEFGVALFYRGQRRLVPTPQGRLFYPRAQRVLETVDEFPGLFERPETRARLPLRIVCQSRTANGLVLPALERFASVRPDVRFTFDTHDLNPSARLSPPPADMRFDAAVYVVPMPADDVRLTAARTLPLDVVLPIGHPLADHAALTPADLAGERYIALRRGLITRDIIDRELARVGERLDSHHEVSHTGAALRLVAAGLGYMLVDATAREPWSTGHVVAIPFEPRIQIDLGVYVPAQAPVHEATEAFATCITDVWNALSP